MIPYYIYRRRIIKMKEFELSNLDKFKKSTMKAAEEFCWNGYRVLTFCPICLKTHFSDEEARLLTKAFNSTQNSKKVEAFADAHDIAILILVPSKPETAQLLNYRLILAPVCNDHPEIDGPEIEKRILGISRFGEIVKG